MNELSKEALIKELDKAVGIKIIAYEQIKRLIEAQAESSEEWIKRMTENLRVFAGWGSGMNDTCEKFVRDHLLKEVLMKKPKVSREFIEKWKRTFKQMDGCYTPSEILIEFSEAFIKEAGVEVEE